MRVEKRRGGGEGGGEVILVGVGGRPFVPPGQDGSKLKLPRLMFGVWYVDVGGTTGAVRAGIRKLPPVGEGHVARVRVCVSSVGALAMRSVLRAMYACETCLHARESILAAWPDYTQPMAEWT